MQGKLFQKCTHLLYCSVLSLGGNANTRRVSKPDMGSIFHIKNQWNILGIGNYYVNYQNDQNLMLLTPSDTNLQIPPKEKWFQCVRRVYTTAINFPCITPLVVCIFYRWSLFSRFLLDPIKAFDPKYVLTSVDPHTDWIQNTQKPNVRFQNTQKLTPENKMSNNIKHQNTTPKNKHKRFKMSNVTKS